MDIARYIDHTMLRATTTSQDIRQLCKEAEEHSFAAVCVPPPFVRDSKKFLKDCDVRVATVIGFPFGYSVAAAKMVETERAIADGADELDVVINLAALKSGTWDYVESEIKKIHTFTREHGRIIKVIIESGVLTQEETIRCCKVFGGIGVDYVKTSTGYAEKGATLETVQLMRAILPSNTMIKASGGVKTFELAKQFVEAGANRIGTSSGMAIIKHQL